jgi:hypothetical protein
MPISEYEEPAARSPTTSDVFNAIAEVRRRDILDVLITGEKPEPFLRCTASPVSPSGPSRVIQDPLDRAGFRYWGS